jgi:hypothetical protein
MGAAAKAHTACRHNLERNYTTLETHLLRLAAQALPAGSGTP